MPELTTGKRLFSTSSSVEVIVVTGASVELACGGAPFTDVRPDAAAHTATGPELAMGKRYVDTESGLLVMVTRSGAGPLTADGRELVQREAAALPSSD